MRILTGKFKRRVIEMPRAIEPTQQKVRKAVFDVLTSRINEAIFLELFAGSGAVGIEALSNGAKEVIFVENDRDCLRTLEKNLSKLGVDNYRIDADDAIGAIKHLFDEGRRFDLIFLDPPYHPECSDTKKQFFETPDIHKNSFYIRSKGLRNEGKKAGGREKKQEQAAQLSLARKALINIASYDILFPCGFVVVQHHARDILPESFGNLTLYKTYSYASNKLSFYEKG